MVAHFTVTLTGSAQRLGAGLNFSNVLAFLSIQMDPANTHVAYVGGNQATLSSSDYGYRLEIPPSSIPYAPSILEFSGGRISMDDFFVLGTNGEKLHILAIV